MTLSVWSSTKNEFHYQRISLSPFLITDRIPESGGRGGPAGGFGGGFDSDYGGGGHHFELGGRRFENPTPANTIEQLPNDLRQVLLDWAHEQDKSRNDGKPFISVDISACLIMG